MNDQQKTFQKKLQGLYRSMKPIEPLFECQEENSVKMMNDYYIRLQTVIHVKDDKKQSSSDKGSTKKQEIDVENIFDKLSGEGDGQVAETNKVLILGPSGMGKSTLMKYIAYKWGEGKLWEDKFDFVYRIPLKILLDNNWKSGYSEIDSCPLKCLVHYHLKSLLHWKDISNFKIENIVWTDDQDEKSKKRILLLLDGYDEVVNPYDKFLNDLFERAFEEFENIILTSRPNALSQEMAKKFDRKIETVGLGTAGINQYFSQYFEEDKEKGKKLKEYLIKNPTIRDICNTPVNIAMLCFLWSKKTTEQLDEILSLSDLYRQVVHRLGVRTHVRIDSHHHDSLDEMIEDEGAQIDELKVLQHVAYHSLIGRELEHPQWQRFENQKIKGKTEKDDEFSIQHSIDILRDKDMIKTELRLSKVNKYGLLKAEAQGTETSSTETDDTKLQDMTFSFIHSSFQEYLTARYLVEQLKSNKYEDKAKIANIANFIARHRNEPRLALILKFMAGILRKVPNQNEEVPPSIKIFWDAVLCNPNGALELGIDAKVNLLMNLLSQSFGKDGKIDQRISHQELAVKFIDCRVLENILSWAKELKESNYISPNIKEGLKILFNIAKNVVEHPTETSKKLYQKLSSNLKREDIVNTNEIVVPNQDESGKRQPSTQMIDQKPVQEEINSAISSLIFKFSNDDQEKIIKKFLSDISNPKENAQKPHIAKKNIQALTNVVQTINLSKKESENFIEILFETIFDENLGQTSRTGIIETLMASEDPATAKEFIKKRLLEVQVDPNTKNLRGRIELALAAGGDNFSFLQEIMEQILPLLKREEPEITENITNFLIDLVQGCQEKINSRLLLHLKRRFFEIFNENKMNFQISAIQSLISSKIMRAESDLLNEIARDFTPFLRGNIGEEYYRDLLVIDVLVPPLYTINKPKVDEIASILIGKLQNLDERGIENLGRTLETIARAYGNTKKELNEKMIENITLVFKNSSLQVRMQALELMEKIAKAAQNDQLYSDAIKEMTPSLCDAEKESRENALKCIIELFKASQIKNLSLFKDIMNNLIQTLDDLDPSVRSASSKSLKDLISKSGIPDLNWLKDIIDTLMHLAEKPIGVSKREIVFDTVLDLAKIKRDDVQHAEIIEKLTKTLTSKMEEASPELKARMGVMVVRLKKIINNQDIQLVEETFNGLTLALQDPDDDIKLTSAKNMLGLYRILLQENIKLQIDPIGVFHPLLKTNNPTLRAAIIFYITEIFEISGHKDMELMKQIIPDLFADLEQSFSGSQPIQQSALLGFAKLLEMSKDADLKRSESLMNALKSNQSSIEIEKFTSSIQSLVIGFNSSDDKTLKQALEKFLIPLVIDAQVGKIVSEKIPILLSSICKRDFELMKNIDASLEMFLEEKDPHSKGWIFKLKLDIINLQNPVDMKQIDKYITDQRPFLRNENSEVKQNAFVYIIEAIKIKNVKLMECINTPNDGLTQDIKKQMSQLIQNLNSQNAVLIQDINIAVKEILFIEKNKQLQAGVANNIVDFLKIASNQDQKLLEQVMQFFIETPHAEEVGGEKKSCNWVLKLLRTQNDKEFLDKALKEVIPRLNLVQHFRLAQKLSVHVLPHIDLIEKCLDHKENPDLRRNFRAGMSHYFKNYLKRFEALEELIPESGTNLTPGEIKEKLLEKIHDKDDYVRRTYNFKTESNVDRAVLRKALIAELDRVETEEKIEIVRVAFIVIAKVEYSQFEVEKELPGTAWEVIVKALEYYREEKLNWIEQNLGTIEKLLNPGIFEAIFGKLYHKILKDGVKTSSEEKLITEFIHRGLSTSITKKEITFQDIKYEMKDDDTRFIFEKIARMVIRKGQDLLGKQYETNTPLFKKSYLSHENDHIHDDSPKTCGHKEKADRIREAAVDIRKMISVVDTKFVLRNDFWVLTHLKSINTGSGLALLEQRSAFGDHVVYKSEGQNFVELPENFTLVDVFGKYHPGLMFKGRSKVLDYETGQKLVKAAWTEFEDIQGSHEDSDFYYQQELLKMGRDDRIIRTLESKQENPLRSLQKWFGDQGIGEEEREKRRLLQQYYEGFLSTFSSVYIVSLNVNSSTFQTSEIKAELSLPASVFTKLVGLIPYGIGKKLSQGIVEALNYIEKTKFANDNKFMKELAIDPVDLSDWVGKIARKRLELPNKIKEIMEVKEENTEGWIKKLQDIEKAILRQIELWKIKVVEKTGEKNLFVKEIKKSLAFRLGESEANGMIEAWFGYCHTLDKEFSDMTQDEIRNRFTKALQINQNNQDNQNGGTQLEGEEFGMANMCKKCPSCNPCNIF